MLKPLLQVNQSSRMSPSATSIISRTSLSTLISRCELVAASLHSTAESLLALGASLEM